MDSTKLIKLFNFVYAELNLSVKEQINFVPNTTTNIVVATYDPRFIHDNNINKYKITLDNGSNYFIINKQRSDLYIHNPTLLTLQKKG